MLESIGDAISDNKRHIEFYLEYTGNETTDGLVYNIIKEQFEEKGYEFWVCGASCCWCCEDEDCEDEDCDLEGSHYCVSWDSD